MAGSDVFWRIFKELHTYHAKCGHQLLGGHYTRLMLLYQYFKAVILTLFALYGVL